MALVLDSPVVCFNTCFHPLQGAASLQTAEASCPQDSSEGVFSQACKVYCTVTCQLVTVNLALGTHEALSFSNERSVKQLNEAILAAVKRKNAATVAS